MIYFAITLYSHAKDYALPKFAEMLESCVLPHDETIVTFYGDTDHRILGNRERVNYTYMPHPGGRYFAEDMLMHARERARFDAIGLGADKMVWAGVDWYFDAPGTLEYERLISHDVPVVAPLITARADENTLICRTFDSDENGYHETQHDVPWVNQQGLMLVQGFPGADSIVIDKELFDISLTDGHDPWYKRADEGRPILCCEENWILEALRCGFDVYSDTDIRVWHAHDVDGLARRWPGIKKPLGDLSWNTR